MNINFWFVLFSAFSVCWGTLPIVLWHGMGDSCCNSGSLGRIITVLEDALPNVEVLSLKFGNNVIEDVESGYFRNPNDQVTEACNIIANDTAFQNGYNAIGFSQGAQFLRAVAQRCPSPPMKTLISLGGQHQGIYGLPNCAQPTTVLCDYMRKLLSYGAYIGWVQKGLVQAQYWHDPLDEAGYKEYSLFLADINNEKAERNESYVTNLKSLERLVLVKFDQDTMVTPRESSWFGFYAPGQAKEVIPFDQTDLFTKDLIGLKSLVGDGKVDFVNTEGNHLQFTDEWFTQQIIEKYLKEPSSPVPTQVPAEPSNSS